MGKPSMPEAPDVSEIAAASKEAAELSYQMAQDQLQWAKDQYAMDKETIDQVVASMLETEDFNQANAEADRARYEQVFQPIEDQFIKQVQDYASPERTQFEVGRAQADVATQFDASREAATKQLESFGINPADTRYAGLDAATKTAQAAATAGAGTQAATNVANTQLAMMGDVINLGKGYPTQVAQSYNTALQAGSGAAGATNAATSTASGAMNAPAGYMTAGNQAVDSWGNVINQNYANQVSAYNASLQASAGWGSALGSLAGMAAIPLMKMQEGGVVPHHVSPSHGAIPDDVAVAASAGEFVVPEDVVAWKGQEYFHKEIQKARQKKTESAIPVGQQPEQQPQQQPQQMAANDAGTGAQLPAGQANQGRLLPDWGSIQREVEQQPFHTFPIPPPGQAPRPRQSPASFDIETQIAIPMQRAFT